MTSLFRGGAGAALVAALLGSRGDATVGSPGGDRSVTVVQDLVGEGTTAEYPFRRANLQ